MFYNKFKEKVKVNKLELKNKIYKYGLNYRKRFVWGIVGTNLFILGSYFTYANYQNGNKFSMILSLIVLFFAFSFIYMIFEYKISVDLQKREIFYKKVEISLDNIKKVTLRYMLPPGMKKLEICLDIITKDKVQIIIPLMMNNKLEFTLIIKEIMEREFYIE